MAISHDGAHNDVVISGACKPADQGYPLKLPGLSSVRVYRALDSVAALAKWTEKAVACGQRVLLVTPTQDQAALLDEKLWTYASRSFLPHGLQGKQDNPQEQPVWISWTWHDNANQAQTLVVMDSPEPQAGTLPDIGQLAHLGIEHLAWFVCASPENVASRLESSTEKDGDRETRQGAGPWAHKVRLTLSRLYRPLADQVRLFDQTPTGWVQI